MGEKGKNRGEIRKISHWYMYFSVSDYVNLHFAVTNYQNLLVIFTAALSPTISSTHMTLLLHIKDSMG